MRASLRSGPPGVFTMADPGVHDDRNPQIGTYYLSAQFPDTDGHILKRIRGGFGVEVKVFDERIVKFLEARTLRIDQLSRRRVLVRAVASGRTRGGRPLAG